MGKTDDKANKYVCIKKFKYYEFMYSSVINKKERRLMLCIRPTLAIIRFQQWSGLCFETNWLILFVLKPFIFCVGGVPEKWHDLFWGALTKNSLEKRFYFLQIFNILFPHPPLLAKPTVLPTDISFRGVRKECYGLWKNVDISE